MAVPHGSATETPDLAGLENRLAATLDITANEIAHADCLDGEKRAEVYTILEIIKADSARHRQMLGTYVSDDGIANA